MNPSHRNFKKKYKGLILAAGLGTRLLPLTKEIPKPLIPILGPTALDLALLKMSCCIEKISDLAINTHYFADKIHQHIAKSLLFNQVKISHEPFLLGTGGALSPLIEWIGDSDLIIYNSDIVSDIHIEEALTHHEKYMPEATLIALPVLLPNKNPLNIQKDRIIHIGETLANPETTKHTFTGAHILSNSFIKSLAHKTGNWHITDTYQELLAKKKHLSAFIHNGYWSDIGSIRDYFETIMHLLDHPDQLHSPNMGITQFLERNSIDFIFLQTKLNSDKFGPVFITPKMAIPPHAIIGPNTALINPPNLPRGLHISSSIILPNSILYPNETIQNEIRLHGQLIKI